MDFEFQEVEDLNLVPEQFRGLYSEADGKHRLSENYKGVAEAVTGLNRSLKAARAEAKALKGQKVDLSELAEFGEDPATIAASVRAKLEELTAQAGKPGVNIEKIKEDLTKAHAKDLDKANKRGEALQSQLYGLLVENSATAAISEMKGVPELLMPFVKTQVKVAEEDGEFRVFVVDAQGDRRYSGVTGQPMSIKELVSEMKANEKFGRLFESEAPAGGGTPPRGPSRQVQQPRGEMSSNDKIKAGLAKGQAVSRGGLRR